MDLKSTKATAAPHTNKPSPHSGPLSSTEKASRGSRNSCRGRDCEKIALQFYLKRNYTCLKQRWKSPFAEIDLVLRSSEGNLTLVEVKSLPSMEYLHVRLSRLQKTRLRRALLFSLERDPSCRMELAVVSQSGQVQIFEDLFSF